MPMYYVTKRYVITYNRREMVEAANEDEAYQLTQHEDGTESGLYEQYSQPKYEDTDVNEEEE